MACSTTGQTRKRVMPPTYFLIALLLVVAVRFVLFRWAYSTPLTLGVGVVLLVAGIWLDLAGDSAFKRRGTPVSPDATPSALVTSGVFRWTRNPMYLGMVVMVAAVAALLGAFAGLVVPAVLVVVLDREFVTGEERRLAEAFGSDYAEYASAVRRWI